MHQTEFHTVWIQICCSKRGFRSLIDTFSILNYRSFRVRLDVDIEDLGIEFDQIPNQTSFGNGSQCQSDCLEDELLDRNQRDNKYQITEADGGVAARRA